jgi:hypothetical protein
MSSMHIFTETRARLRADRAQINLRYCRIHFFVKISDEDPISTSIDDAQSNTLTEAYIALLSYQ